MILVLPMAGRGERFVRAGYTIPKPLIALEESVPMFARAASSFPLEQFTEIIFVVLREHCELYQFDSIIRRHYAHFNIKVVVLDNVTSGQAETVALALAGKSRDEELIVFNGDSAFNDDISPWLIENASHYDGALQVFRDTDPRWSFARVDDNGKVLETAEKRVISDLASTGMYYFKSWVRYMRLYDKLELSGGEKYIAPMFNHLIAAGGRVGIIPCRSYLCFGTPADLEACRAGKRYGF